MLTLDKEQIIEIIESDNAYTKAGRYRSDFIDDTMGMCYEYTFQRRLGTTLAFKEKECSFSLKTMVITVTVVVEDTTHLLVKEMRSDKDGTEVEFWLLDRVSLIGDVVWEYMG